MPGKEMQNEALETRTADASGVTENPILLLKGFPDIVTPTFGLL